MKKPKRDTALKVAYRKWANTPITQKEIDRFTIPLTSQLTDVDTAKAMRFAFEQGWQLSERRFLKSKKGSK